MLFNLYSGVAGTQLLGWLCVFIGLIVLNEIGRRTKAGGIAVFMVIPAILTVYFILANCGLFGGKENLSVKYMSGWFHYFKLYAATIGCIGFIMIKYQWGIGAKHWFKPWPFVIVAANILIAVVSDFESLAKGGMNGGWIQNRAFTLSVWCMFAQVVPTFQLTRTFGVLPSVYGNAGTHSALDMYNSAMNLYNSGNATGSAVAAEISRMGITANPGAQGVVAVLSIVINVLVLTAIIKRSIELKKNPYKNEIWAGTKDFDQAMARAE